MRFTGPEPLGDEHPLEGFASGEKSLDDWLSEHARQAEAGHAARTYVATDPSTGRVAGYHALAAGSVRPLDATRRLAAGQPTRRPIAVILLARLAVDRDYQGGGLGRSLLADAMLRSAAAAQGVGARALVVNALDDHAASFYERFGFERSPTDPHHLILLMKDLEKFLAGRS